MILFSLHLVVLLWIVFQHFNNFPFGISLFFIIFMINGCAGLIYLNVHKAVIRPVNDPGITIWWLCCIKFGQTGKFSREFREKEIERKRL